MSGRQYPRIGARRKETVKGDRPCSVCGGTLSYRRSAYNGHVAINCPGLDPAKGPCLAMME